MTKIETVVKKLDYLSVDLVELSAGLETGKISIDSVPRFLMEYVDEKPIPVLRVPEHNLTESKYHQNGYKTRQVCVIENTEDNRKAIRQLNKIAKEQDSMYRFSIRYRKPKEGHKYGHGGELRKENALGIGLYIEGAIPSDSRLFELKVANERIDTLTSEYDVVEEKLKDTAYELVEADNEIERLRKIERSVKNFLMDDSDKYLADEIDRKTKRIEKLENQLEKTDAMLERYVERCHRSDKKRSELTFELVALKDKINHVISNIL